MHLHGQCYKWSRLKAGEDPLTVEKLKLSTCDNGNDNLVTKYNKDKITHGDSYSCASSNVEIETYRLQNVTVIDNCQIG